MEDNNNNNHNNDDDDDEDDDICVDGIRLTNENRYTTEYNISSKFNSKLIGSRCYIFTFRQAPTNENQIRAQQCLTNVQHNHHQQQQHQHHHPNCASLRQRPQPLVVPSLDEHRSFEQLPSPSNIAVGGSIISTNERQQRRRPMQPATTEYAAATVTMPVPTNVETNGRDYVQMTSETISSGLSNQCRSTTTTEVVATIAKQEDGKEDDQAHHPHSSTFTQRNRLETTTIEDHHQANNKCHSEIVPSNISLNTMEQLHRTTPTLTTLSAFVTGSNGYRQGRLIVFFIDIFY